jgi:hypothetical protein
MHHYHEALESGMTINSRVLDTDPALIEYGAQYKETLQ